MQKNIFKKFIVILSLGFILFGFNFVFAGEEDITPPEASIIIAPAIATSDSFIVEKNIIVPDNCSVKDTNGNIHLFLPEDSPSKYLGICALAEAKAQGAISNFDIIGYSFGLFVDSINKLHSSTAYWALYLNDKYEESRGLVDLPLVVGDKMSLVYVDFNNMELGSRVDIQISALAASPEKVVRSSSSGSYITKPVIIEKVFKLENAFKFLEINQKSDGSYSSPMYTDWVAIAISLGDNQIVKSNLINYFKSNNIDSSIITDYERRAMALMSLGVNPYNGTEINYIKKITDSFDGTQFGDKTLENDDIFALVVLKNAGYSEKDEIVLKDINYIISKQNKDGSWGSVDMTSAGAQALRGFENIAGVNDSISKAKNYLISKQEEDGGLGNSFSTSWVLQSLFSNDKILKAENYLISKQEEDGGMGKIKDEINSRIWATAYTIPAILHKPWSEILNNFSKPIKKEIIKKSVEEIEQSTHILEKEEINNENTILPSNNNFWSKLKNSFKQFLIYLKF